MFCSFQGRLWQECARREAFPRQGPPILPDVPHLPQPDARDFSLASAAGLC
jgi:hypothetical protein